MGLQECTVTARMSDTVNVMSLNNWDIASSIRDPPTTDVRVLTDGVSVIPEKDSQVKGK